MENIQNLTTERSIVIDANAESIWDVLTNPGKIKLYLFGSEVVTDWKVGSPVSFSRETNGTKYRDKGNILEVSHGTVLKFTYWSSQEGYADIPENYSIITYTFDKENDHSIKLKYCHEKIPIEFERRNQEKYLPGMLENIKRLAEEVYDL